MVSWSCTGVSCDFHMTPTFPTTRCLHRSACRPQPNYCVELDCGIWARCMVVDKRRNGECFFKTIHGENWWEMIFIGSGINSETAAPSRIQRFISQHGSTFCSTIADIGGDWSHEGSSMLSSNARTRRGLLISTAGSFMHSKNMGPWQLKKQHMRPSFRITSSMVAWSANCDVPIVQERVRISSRCMEWSTLWDTFLTPRSARFVSRSTTPLQTCRCTSEDRMHAESNYMEHDTDAHRCRVLDPASVKSNAVGMMVFCRIFRLTDHVYLLGRVALLMQNVGMLSLRFLIKQACRRTLSSWKSVFDKLSERCRSRGLHSQRRFCIAVPIWQRRSWLTSAARCSICRCFCDDLEMQRRGHFWVVEAREAMQDQIEWHTMRSGVNVFAALTNQCGRLLRLRDQLDENESYCTPSAAVAERATTSGSWSNCSLQDRKGCLCMWYP